VMGREPQLGGRMAARAEGGHDGRQDARATSGVGKMGGWEAAGADLGWRRAGPRG